MELKVTFKTITPIYTGDAWQQCEEIKPASIMGSLRFWFEVLCYFNGVIDNEYFDENGKPSETLDYKKFKELKDKIKSKMDLENAIDTILKDMEISLPSRIFGCTGWKGKIRIKNISYEKPKKLERDNINFEFPLNKLKYPKNSKFWISKSLFNGKNEIYLFENVNVKIEVENYWFERYLKKFFEFYNDKIILVGGKNSFGFGFVKLNTNGEYKDINESDKTENREDNSLIYKNFGFVKLNTKIKLKNIPLKTDKNILGFNFRYYLRLNEGKKHRTKNFGKQGSSSNFYVSNLLDDNSIMLVGINNPFNPIFRKEELFKRVSKKYENLLFKTSGGIHG